MSSALVDLVALFFCQQNTAYEMRMSDWSSDVCSSDLASSRSSSRSPCRSGAPASGGAPKPMARRVGRATAKSARLACSGPMASFSVAWVAPIRSEEHTSELQSLMRSSYAVFCLKTKNEHRHEIQKDLTYTKLQHTKILPTIRLWI